MGQMSACTSASAAVANGQLVSAIGLHDPHGLLHAGADRLALSGGTQPAKSMVLPGYRDTAFVPCGPWRQPSREEQHLLLAAQPAAGIGSCITLVRAPHDVMCHFDPLRERLHSCRSLAELRAWLHQHPCRTGCDAMLAFARRYLTGEQALLEGGAISCRAGGSPTATTDDSGAHVGLHVDNWYRAKLDERAHAPNRISINIGVTPRFFLYINLPLATIGSLAAERLPSDSGVREIQHGLRSVFMSHFASYPVVRVRLDPGEGYIAPTENLIHDAATAGTDALDVQFRVRGRFWGR
jgi:hypothetical protein